MDIGINEHMLALTMYLGLPPMLLASLGLYYYYYIYINIIIIFKSISILY